MAIVFAVTKLYDDVVAVLTADAAAADPEADVVPIVFGWRELGKHPVGPSAGTARRIVWVPGDDASGNLGELLPPKQPGRNPRSLATLAELVTVYLETADLASAVVAEDERAQYQACRELYDAWYRAVQKSAPGTHQVISAAWVTTQKERRHGAALRVVLAVEAMVPDKAFALIGTGARATWTVDLDDVQDSGSTIDAPP